MIEVAALLHIVDGRLLMARGDGKTGFYLPGGKIDPGESALEALHREVREELATGVIAETLTPFGRYEAQAFARPPGVMVSVQTFVGELAGQPTPSSEVVEIRFFSAEEYSREPHRAQASEAVIRDLCARGMMR